MRTATSVVERAFQVAASCVTLHEIRLTLKHEGYDQVEAHLGGRMIRGELTKLLRKKGAGGLTPAPIF